MQPDGDHNIWQYIVVVVSGALGAVGWWIKQQVARLRRLEENKASKEELRAAVDAMQKTQDDHYHNLSKQIERTDTRIEAIYMHLVGNSKKD